MIRRLLRLTIAGLCLLSLAGCLAVALLWARTRHAGDRVGRVWVVEDGAGVSSRQWSAWAGADGVLAFRIVMRRPADSRGFRDLMAGEAGRGWVRETLEGPQAVDLGAFRRSYTATSPAAGDLWGVQFLSARSRRGDENVGMVKLPFWLLFALTAALPGWRLLRALGGGRERRRAGANLCLDCGYSLMGNESGVCPECGIVPAGKGAG